MRKTLSGLALLSAMLLCVSAAFAADDDAKPKKGKIGEKLKGKLGDVLNKDKLFEKLDADSDGKISKAEFKKVFENLGGDKLKDVIGDKAGDLADKLFERLDGDSDGSLSKEEFAKFGANAGNGELKDKLKNFKGKFGKKGEKKKDEKKDD